MVMVMVMMFWLCWVSLPKIDVSLIGLVYHHLLFSYFFFFFVFFFVFLLLLHFFSFTSRDCCSYYMCCSCFSCCCCRRSHGPAFLRCAILLGPGERRVRHTRALHQHQAVSPQCQCLPGACDEPHSQICWRTFQELWLRGWYLHVFENCRSLGLRLSAVTTMFFFWLTLRFFIRQPASFFKFLVAPLQVLWDEQLGEECEALNGSPQQEPLVIPA